MKVRKPKNLSSNPSSLDSDTDNTNTYYKNRNRNNVQYACDLYRVPLREFKKLLSRRMEAFDLLHRRYFPNLEKIGNATEFIKRKTMFLAHAVKPQAVICLMLLAYQRNHSQFSISEEEVLRQVRVNLKLALSQFPYSIGEENKEFYNTLSPLERAAYRIFRSLAYFTRDVAAFEMGLKKGTAYRSYFHSMKKPKPFFISCNDLATRLLLKHPEHAQRLLEFFCTNTLRLVKKGDHFSKRPQELGAPVHASEYEFLPSEIDEHDEYITFVGI